MATLVSSSIFQVNPQEVFSDGFEFQNQTIIPSQDFQGTFNPEINTVELYIYDQTVSLLSEIPNFSNYQINDNINSDTNDFGGTNILELDPVNDVVQGGFENGVLYAFYNFINYELASSNTNLYYIQEISPDRTEIRLESNFINDTDIEYSYNIFKESLESADYFDEFYISLGSNESYVAVNCELDTAGDKFSILIKLYEELPDSVAIENECYVVTKVAETQGYQIQLLYDNTVYDNVNYIKGPNTNLEVRDFVNNSTELLNKNQLTTATNNFSGSENQLTNILNRNGVTIEPDYSFKTFDDFVHFSSAKSRINNFITKLKKIESYESDLDTLTSIIGNTLTVPSQSLGVTIADKSDLIITLDYQDIDVSTGAIATVGDALTGSITQNITDGTDGTYTVSPTTNGPGVGAVLEVVVSSNSVLNITATTAGSGYVVEASQSLHVSNSIASLANKIQTEIKNMDGYEYYLYYNTSSMSYPKEGVGISGYSFPYAPTASTSTEALTWLGSDIQSNQYYGGIILSASRYDEDNKDWLYYTVPEYIKENNANDNYMDFVDMIGQHFDEIWLYTRAVTSKLNTTNVLDKGVPLQLADDVITSLGYEGLTNQYNNQDNFIGLVGENNREYCPPTGSELILDYICINKGEIQNYWAQYYSWEDYVEQLITPGWPYPIDRVSKEIFKRLYHNMSYLVKTKGTPAGLRQLINIWGIPNTILRINEFGGKNRDNTDDYDLWYNRYSYAYKPISTQNVASSSVVMPWMPLYRNYVSESKEIVPDGFAFRFKTTGYPSSSVAGVGDYFSQSLAIKVSQPDEIAAELISSSGDLNGPISASGDFGIALYYTGSTTGSYSGSSNDQYKDWGLMQFYISGSTAEGGVAKSDFIYLPFFNKGWWTVMLQRDTHTDDETIGIKYTLNVANKMYNGYDGNQVGFTGSAIIDSNLGSNLSQSINFSWNNYNTGSSAGIYLGGMISGSIIGTDASSHVTMSNYGKIFSGSLQEFRYYGEPLYKDGSVDITSFNDFVMNPESIEGLTFSGSNSSYDMLNFRAPLGNELENYFTASYSSSYTESISSLHPAVTCSTPFDYTSSFMLRPITVGTSITSSNFHVIYYSNTSTRTFSETNREIYYLDQPVIGIRNRVTNKIQIDNDDAYEKVLSNQRSIRQDYQISASYTEDINNAEAGFSYQNEINDDIIQAFGYGVVQDRIADPRQLFSVSGSVQADTDYYPNLRILAKDYFRKYKEGNVLDYMRLIKYFDNSIFKAIKNWAPARTGMSTGIIIKQHTLERNRYPEPVVTLNTNAAAVDQSPWNTYEVMQDLINSGSLIVVNTTGGTGGVLDKFNQKNYFLSASCVNVNVASSASVGPPYGLLAGAEIDQLNINQAFKFDSSNGTFENVRNKDLTFSLVATLPGDIAGSQYQIMYSSSYSGISTLGYAQASSGSLIADFKSDKKTLRVGEAFALDAFVANSPYGPVNTALPSATFVSQINVNTSDATLNQTYVAQTLQSFAGLRFNFNLRDTFVKVVSTLNVSDGTYTGILINPFGSATSGVNAYVDLKVLNDEITEIFIDTDPSYTNNGGGTYEPNDEIQINGSQLGGTGTVRYRILAGSFTPNIGTGATFTIETNGAGAVSGITCIDGGSLYSEGDQFEIRTSLIGGSTNVWFTLFGDSIVTSSINLTRPSFKFHPNGYVAYGGNEPHDKFAFNHALGIQSTSSLLYTTGSLPVLDRAQAWYFVNETPKGAVPGWDATEKEFYNGEFSGSKAQVTTQSLNPRNPFVTNVGEQELQYYVYVYSGSYNTEGNWLSDGGNLDASLTASNDQGIVKFYKQPSTEPVQIGNGGAQWSTWPY